MITGAYRRMAILLPASIMVVVLLCLILLEGIGLYDDYRYFDSEKRNIESNFI